MSSVDARSRQRAGIRAAGRRAIVLHTGCIGIGDCEFGVTHSAPVMVAIGISARIGMCTTIMAWKFCFLIDWLWLWCVCVCYNYQCIGVLEDMLAEVYTKALLIKRLHEQPAQPPTVEQLKRGLKYVAGASSTVAQHGGTNELELWLVCVVWMQAIGSFSKHWPSRCSGNTASGRE
jgi:hypothetical protein